MAEIRGPLNVENRQLANTFIRRELDGENELVKMPQREKVLEFILRYQDRSHLVRCFGLPGIRWGFENMLFSCLGSRCRFVGVERNYTVLRKSLVEMPGRGRCYEQMENKRGAVLRGFCSGLASVFWCSCSHFMRFGGKCCLSKKEYPVFASRFRQFTCAWLDFSSSIDEEIVNCCKMLEFHVHEKQDWFPFAVTFQIGRERAWVSEAKDVVAPGEDTLESRVTLIRAAFESNRFRCVKVVDAWKYLSTGGCSMGVMQGLLVRKNG